ncbi:MAG: addiction module protein [Planctomycetales bacterium]|nr:addiction module protein [Planctomycetales bacterium]MCA9239210.1 addiction module protein [Planctomycetales bacterium]
MNTLINQISQLPVAEQLAIVQEIWDGLHESPELVQQWQVAEARRRSSELLANPSHSISEAELWRRVDELLLESR